MEGKITFSTRYKKMLPGIEYYDTFVKDVYITDFKLLTSEEIEQDTAMVNGGHFPLPNGVLICVVLWTATINGGVEWKTYRLHNKEKEMYYRRLRGKQVKIVIE